MLLRLLLVMMLAFAAPAMPVAACHDAPARAATHLEASHTRRQQPMETEHLCVGCAAVADWKGTRVTPPIMPPAVIPAVKIAALSLLPGEAPTPPPPRMA